jgi:hypothetical protein
MPLVMPMLEIKAMPVAAVCAGRWLGGSAQKIGSAAKISGRDGKDRQRHREARHVQRQRHQRQRASAVQQEEMSVAFAETVGAPRNQDQTHRPDRIRDDRVETDGHHVMDAKSRIISGIQNDSVSEPQVSAK